MTGPLVPRSLSYTPYSSIQLDLATRPPGPCSFLSQGHCYRAVDSRTMSWDMVDKGASVWPPPSGCREGRLFLEWGWGRGEIAPGLCVCVSVHIRLGCVHQSVHVRLGPTSQACCSSPRPPPRFWGSLGLCQMR